MNVHSNDYEPARELPANIEAEQALLGAVLVNNDAYDAIAGVVEPESFFEPLHQKIFGASASLITSGQVANPVTVKSFLPENEIISDGVTVSHYLARLATEAVTIINAPDYARGVQIDHLRRRLIAIGDQLTEGGFGLREPVELLEQIEALQSRLDETIAGLAGKEERRGSDIANDYFAAISKVTDEQTAQGVPICLPEIATVLSDAVFRPKRIYGLLSSSGEGKTSLTLQIIRHALVSGNPVLFLSFDQTWQECVAQMAAQDLGIELRRQMQRDLNDSEREQCLNYSLELGSMPFEVIDCTDETAVKLASYAKSWLKRKAKANPKTPLLVIDHIGAVKPDNPRADEGSKARQIAQDFKSLAKATNSAVLVLQQRSSAGMKRPNPRPTTYDLYGGEAARQPFDGIFYLYRGEKFRKEQMAIAATDKEFDAIDKRFPMSVWENKAEIGALKVRFGDPAIRRKVEWEGAYTRYRSMQNTDQEDLPL